MIFGIASRAMPQRDGRAMMSVLTAPLIYPLTIPLLLLDIVASIYQALCFRAYGIARVTLARTDRARIARDDR